MKTKLAVGVAVVVLLGLAAFVWSRQTSAPVGKPGDEIAIQDGKSIDFSSGKPVIKDSAKEKAAIAKAVKEMEEATQDVVFAPTAPPAPKPAGKK